MGVVNWELDRDYVGGCITDIDRFEIEILEEIEDCEECRKCADICVEEKY